MTATTDTLPLDWNEWRAQWNHWKNTHDLKRPRVNPWTYKGKNFLADDVLGVYRVNGRTVELSEVTFPNLHDRDERGNLIHAEYRYIGLTFEDGATDLARSFSDLERILGIGAA